MPTEFDIIDRLRKRALVDDHVLLGIGDDAAVIKGSGGRDLVACCDLMIEGVHFRTEWISPGQLGRKALAVNLSDIAAMGGVPKYAMLSIAFPRWCTTDFLDDFFDGIFQLAQTNGVSVIGGDTSSSPDSMFIDISLIGECDSGKAVGRRGAQVGDLVYVSGSLGASALGLSLLEDGFRLNEDHDLRDPRRQAVDKHLAPEPRLQLGRVLASEQLVTAMIDISDGLSSDLWHILDESSVGAMLSASSIPIAECVKSIAAVQPEIDPVSLALNGGEEYELLFTARPENQQRVMSAAKTLNAQITPIGYIVEDKGLNLEHNGIIDSIRPLGYQHLL